MVKKLEKVSNVTTSTLQQGQVKKRKIQAKECRVQIKGPNMGHNSAICPIEIKNKIKLSSQGHDSDAKRKVTLLPHAL
jgi:hypothetical protein